MTDILCRISAFLYEKTLDFRKALPYTRKRIALITGGFFEMKYGRVFNFSAGPAMMPEEVLEDIAAEVLNYRGSGMSVMEMSHRSKVFQDIRDEAEADLRKLMGIPDTYKVLSRAAELCSLPWCR